MSKKHFVKLNFPGHVVVFRYTDLPGEWHAMCLETSAFGSGRDVSKALAGVGKSLERRYEELLKRGKAGILKAHPDPEWVRAYKEHKHPAIDRIQVLFCGQVMFPITLVSGKAKVEVPEAINLDPSLAEATLLPA